MIGAVRVWLTSIVMVTLLLSVAQTLIPEGTIRKIAGFTGGLILLVALLRPVLGADLERLHLDLGDYERASEERQEELASAGNAELKALIESQTAAYISDKANALGLEVTVRVEAEAGADGIPVPAAADIQGARSEELASYMEQELGIPRERQSWHEES